MGSVFTVIPGIPPWQIVLDACNILAYVTLFTRVLSIRLTKSYPALTAWLAVNIVLTSLPWLVRMDLLAYYWFYIWSESLELVLYLFTMLELYGKVLKSLPGLASTARVFIQVVVPASALGALSLLAFENHPHSYLDWYYRAGGAVMATLVFFVLMITGFMVWFPIRVTRNTMIYSVGYATYLVPKAASLFLTNSGHGGDKLSGIVGMSMSIVCLLFWAAALERKGETVMVTPGSVFRPKDEARLVIQLEAINRTLSRVAQR